MRCSMSRHAYKQHNARCPLARSNFVIRHGHVAAGALYQVILYYVVLYCIISYCYIIMSLGRVPEVRRPDAVLSRARLRAVHPLLRGAPGKLWFLHSYLAHPRDVRNINFSRIAL